MMKHLVGVAMMVCTAVVLAACGSGSVAPAPSATSPAATASAGGSGGRTPRPDIETAIAEGTMPAGRRFGGGTPPADIQTAVAEGTPFPERTPSGRFQTAVAEGTTPAGFGAGGGSGRTIATVAALLGVSEDQLRNELQTAGATIASVAAAHGKDRATVRQALISDATQRIQQQVTDGRITQAAANQAIAAFTAGVDGVLDGDGSMSPAVPPPGG